MKQALVIDHLTKDYGAFRLDDVSFTVPGGTIVGLIGENGAGKSTTFQCILNLIPRDGGTITLCCERQGTGWRLRVQDNGRGIPPEDLPHVTEAFYMADKSRTRARGGSGLGLSLCAAIAAAHGSKLAIESTPGAGTCVTIDLKDGEEAAPCEP